MGTSPAGFPSIDERTKFSAEATQYNTEILTGIFHDIICIN